MGNNKEQLKSKNVVKSYDVIKNKKNTAKLYGHTCNFLYNKVLNCYE